VSGEAAPSAGPPGHDDDALAGMGGDDVSAGISGSGVGGRQLGDGDDRGEGDETGLDEVVEEGSRTGWGRRGRADET
jgi:hypothetical protein